MAGRKVSSTLYLKETPSIKAARKSLLLLIPKAPQSLAYTRIVSLSPLTKLWVDAFLAEGISDGTLMCREAGKAAFYSRIEAPDLKKPGEATPELPFAQSPQGSGSEAGKDDA